MTASHFISSSFEIMSTTVDFLADDAEITDTKSRKVWLKFHAWGALSNYAKEIDEAFEKRKEQHWVLDKDTDLCADTKFFKQVLYLHIRHWSDPPQGSVSLKADHWNELKFDMTLNEEEYALGKDVLVRMIKDKIFYLMQEECEGCEKDWPPPIDHECLQRDKEELYIDEAISLIKAHDFILRFTAEAWNQELILETPHQTFHKLTRYQLEDVKKEVLK